MFGLLNKSPERTGARHAGQARSTASAAAARDGRRGAGAAPADREARLAAAAASLAGAVAPRLRELIGNGVPAGEIARQAGQQAQIHFRQQRRACCRRSSCAATWPRCCGRCCRRRASARPNPSRRGRRPEPPSPHRRRSSPLHRARRSSGRAQVEADGDAVGSRTKATRGRRRQDRPAGCRAARSTRRAAPCSRWS